MFNHVCFCCFFQNDAQCFGAKESGVSQNQANPKIDKI